MLIDVYVLSANRNHSTIARFLDEVVPERVESAGDYPVPAYSDEPVCTFEKVDDLIDYVLKAPKEPYSLYWRSLATRREPAHAMLFFTGDGHLIYGVSIQSHEFFGSDAENLDADAENIERWLRLLAEISGGTSGYALLESYPEYKTREAFLAECDCVQAPKLVDGKLIRPNPREYQGTTVFR